MSGKQYLLDTNIVVPFLNGDQAMIARIKNLPIIQLPFIVLGELYYGAYKSTQGRQNIAKIKEFIGAHCEIYYASEITLEIYGKIKQLLSKKGRPIPENDIWIAAVAKEHNLSLVSRDKHFAHINGLEIIVW